MPSPYQLYGVAVDSTLPLTFTVPRTTAPPVLRVEASPTPFPSALRDDLMPVSHEDGDGVAIPNTLFRHRDGRRHLLRFENAADFLLAPDAITYHLVTPALAYAVEVWLLGTVFSLWNELRGVPALHAAAVTADGHAVGVLATNKGGKSSLAAALLQAGCPLLTDDILMVEALETTVVGPPSYPQMRMWPDQARHFLGSEAGLPLVVPHLTKRRVPVGPDGFGQFQNGPAPITHLFLPDRRSDVDEVQFQPLSPQAALIELVRHSFLPNTVAQLGLSGRRLPVLVALAQQAHVDRLVYPDGVEHLPRVAAAVLARVHDRRANTLLRPPQPDTAVIPPARTARR